MARGSYSTEPIDQQPEPQPALSVDAPRVHAWNLYGASGNAYIRPENYACVRLAADLSDVWLSVAQEIGRPDSAIQTGTRQFLQHLDTQLHSLESIAEFGASNLRRRHLDAWERDLISDHREANSETAYRKAVYLFALLRRLEEDGPGTLHAEVLQRMESRTRLWLHRNPGVPAFADVEVKRIRGGAHRIVHAHLTSDATEPTSEVLVALHILLSLATGEPAEMLRSLTTNDLVATANADADEPTARLEHNARLAWLADHDAADEYAVTYTKRRAQETYQDVYRRKNHGAHRALTQVLKATAGLRAESRNNALWLVRRRDGSITEPPWVSPGYQLHSFFERGHIEVSGQHHWIRLRKVVVARDAGADPTRYLRMRRRHSPETFFNHYTNSGVLRAKAGQILIDSISEKFTAAVMGPTVVTPDAHDLIASGQSAPGIDATTAQALVMGDLDGPQTACRDPKDSPFAPLGEVCNLSMTGTCFGCGNALITEDHLPAALVIAEIADPDRAADREVWLNYWKPIWDTITGVVLPAFSPETIARARARRHLVPLDLGTRNDMRGTDDNQS